MFNVYNVLVREDEEKEKYNIGNLIQFDKKVVKNGVRVEPFKFWFDCASSWHSSYKQVHIGSKILFSWCYSSVVH
ncbi:Hypothetical predicted protein, partial [Paramuricea clavata]